MALVVSHQRDGVGDRDSLGMLTGLNGQVHSNLLAHLEHNVLALQRLEPFRLHADRVCAGNQGGSVIFAGFIRGEGSRHTSLRVQDGYRGARYDSATLVCNGSENTAEIGLREKGKRDQKHAKCHTEHLGGFSDPDPVANRRRKP